MCFLRKKDTKDLVLESSLSGIHLFQTNSVDNASTESLTKRMEEECRETRQVYLLTQEVWERKGICFLMADVQKDRPLQGRKRMRDN